jgi:hypothetical protein
MAAMRCSLDELRKEDFLLIKSAQMWLLRPLSPHIAELFFGGKAEAAKKRFQNLKAVEILAERARHPFERLSETNNALIPYVHN